MHYLSPSYRRANPSRRMSLVVWGNLALPKEFLQFYSTILVFLCSMIAIATSAKPESTDHILHILFRGNCGLSYVVCAVPHVEPLIHMESAVGRSKCGNFLVHIVYLCNRYVPYYQVQIASLAALGCQCPNHHRKRRPSRFFLFLNIMLLFLLSLYRDFSLSLFLEILFSFFIFCYLT